MTSELTLNFLLKVSQNQIIVTVLPQFLCFEKNLLWRHGQVTAWQLEKRIQVIALDHAKVQPVEQTNMK